MLRLVVGTRAGTVQVLGSGRLGAEARAVTTGTSELGWSPASEADQAPARGRLVAGTTSDNGQLSLAWFADPVHLMLVALGVAFAVFLAVTQEPKRRL